MKCANCEQTIPDVAVFCRYCGARTLRDTPGGLVVARQDDYSQAESRPKEISWCSVCDAELEINDEFCPQCGAEFGDDGPAEYEGVTGSGDFWAEWSTPIIAMLVSVILLSAFFIVVLLAIGQ